MQGTEQLSPRRATTHVLARALVPRALVAGVLAAAVILALRATGVLSGPGAVVAAAIVTIAVPTSRSAATRILVAGSLFFGWIVVPWWWDLPVGDVGRATLLLALLSGSLAAWVVGSPDPRARARALLPRFTPVDVVPAATAVGAALFLLPWLRARTGASALAMLLPGWDNSAHFDMAEMLRRHGATVSALGPAPGDETWKFMEYPQGFHAAAATLMELLVGTGTATPGSELAAMVNATGWIAVLAITTLAAGICTLPGLRDRPAVAAPTTALVVAAFLLGPGAASLPGGFANFFLACVLAACVPIVVVRSDRPTSPLTLAVLGGLLVGVAHTWVLLLALALPAAVLIVVPWRRDRWQGPRAAWIAAGGVVLVTALGGVQAIRLLSTLDADAVLTTQGGINTPDLGIMATVFLVSIGLSLWALADVRRPGVGSAGGETIRSAAAVAVTLVGLAGAAALAALQIRTSSAVTYYFWKYAIGLELVTLVVAVIAGSVVVAGRTSARPQAPRLLATVATLLLSAGAVQAFGFTGVPRGPVPVAPSAIGMALRAAQFAAASSPSSTVREILAAAEVDLPPGSDGVYISPSDDTSVHAVNAQQWYLALTSRWTTQANDRTSALMPPAGAEAGAETDSDRARRVLDDDPAAVAIVAPDRLVSVRSGLEADLAARVLAW